MNREVGKIKWFGGYDHQRNRENNFGFITRQGKPDLYVHRRQVNGIADRLGEGTAVTFIPAQNPRHNGGSKEEACEVRLLREETDRDVLKRCFQDGDKNIWHLAAARYLFHLAPDTALAEVANKVGQLQTRDQTDLILLLREDRLLCPQARTLREALAQPKRSELYRRGVHLEHIVDEIIENPNSFGGPFWTAIQNEIDYGSKLFHAAPNDVKAAVIKRKFGAILGLMRDCIQEPHFKSSWAATEVYKKISDEDRSLAAEWMAPGQRDNERITDFHTARMLSARCAEKVALEYYASLGYRTQDVSITQLDRQTNDWKTYDLLLDGHITVDVKNARTPFHSEKRYVEHCVPKFKENRYGQNVIIAGLLSPYLKLDNLNEPGNTRFSISPITFLGETTQATIAALEQRFCQNNIKLITRNRNVVPPWLFEYPHPFYASRDEKRKQLREALEAGAELPPWSDFLILEKNPLPDLLCAGVPFPAAWNEKLSGWEKDFYARLLPDPGGKITLPVLFLTLLTHFLEMVAGNAPASYKPQAYDRLIYSERDEEHCLPLGIHDPLGIIRDFCRTLGVLWDNRDSTRLQEFKFFKFNGLGLLEGRRLNRTQLETILAYCGGFIPATGKCGFSPLVIGQHENCPQCGKLICDQCGYCNQYCQECGPRMRAYAEESDKKPVRPVVEDELYSIVDDLEIPF